MLNLRHLLIVPVLAACADESPSYPPGSAPPDMAQVSVSVTFANEACAQKFVAELPREYWAAYDESADPVCDDQTWGVYGSDGSCWQFSHICGGSEVWDDPFFTEASPDAPGSEVVCASVACETALSPAWTYPTED